MRELPVRRATRARPAWTIFDCVLEQVTDYRVDGFGFLERDVRAFNGEHRVYRIYISFYLD